MTQIDLRTNCSMRALSLLCTVGLTLFAGCADTSETQDAEESFTVLEQRDDALSAQLRMGDDSVSLRAQATSPQHIDFDFDFGHTDLVMSIDYERGVGEFVPHGEPLDATDGALIDALIAHVAKLVSADEAQRTPLESALLRQISLLQIVPQGEVLSPFEFQSKRGWVHLSCTCSQQNIGGFIRIAGRGCGCTGSGVANGCKGRCGQGCGITSFPPCVGTTVYTQDCAKHDYGLGSFAAASDDYTFAPNNCSCSGVGTCF